MNCCKFIGNKPPCCIPEKEIFFEPLYNTTYGTYRTRSLATAGTGNFSFSVPEDFNELVELYIEALPLVDIAGSSIALNSNYGKIGENYQQNAEINPALAYNLLNNKWNKLDLSSVFSVLAAGHKCGLQITHSVIGTTMHYKHIVLKYR